ncbi:MAG TPA: arginine biosynthesis protein ArgJ [Ruminococcaceae bacterium]|nr:arginine biosynthesis protein ArgJ [Oscillospiraceae bacterium]
MINVITGGVTAPRGFVANGICCGIKSGRTKRDLALIYSKTQCTAASVYTQNKVKGAPIAVTKEHLKNGMASAIVCNSGNANTCNADGIEKANLTCEAVAKALNISADDVIVASTGVIGQPLPIEPIQKGMPELAAILSRDGSSNAAEAIMTTDTAEKSIAVSFDIGGRECKMGAIAKGSGMIHPNMATMLCFVTTDAAITTEMLQKALDAVVADTFNMVSVDGDTSTNDMLSIMANGEAGNTVISAEGEAYDTFLQALNTVCTYISRLMAKDGEGATKLLECTVSSAPDIKTARAVAKSVVTSSLFKAAMFGADANWGRVLCAIGYAEGEFDIDKISVDFESESGRLAVCRNGAGIDFDEDFAKQVLSKDEIKILVSMNSGSSSATAWGCDLTYEYVRINGDYRS